MEKTIKHILLIDDDEGVYLTINHLITKIKGKPFQVDWIDNYDSALETLQSEQYDVCLLDYHLDKKDGICLLEHLKKQHHLIPVVMLTGESDPEVDRGAMHAGAMDYLVKNQITVSLLERSLRYAIERKRIERQLQRKNHQMLLELQQAKNVQLSLLPQLSPEIPDLHVASKYIPVDQIGGDLYDVFMIDQQQLGIFIADVTGHGVSAALISFMVSGLLKSLKEQLYSPKAVFHSLNTSLLQHTPDNRFVTAFYGVYHLITHKLTYSSAGHPAGYHLSNSSKTVRYLEQKPATVLGVFGDSSYENQTFQMLPKDKLFLFTDGIGEMMNEKQEMFQKSGLEKSLTEGLSSSIFELLDQLYQKALHFSATGTSQDDITLIGLERI